MNNHRGWLLDIYSEPNKDAGIVVWFLAENGRRYRLTDALPITFYLAGPFPRLRTAWRYVRTHFHDAQLARTQRRDLFSGMIDLMAITTTTPDQQRRLFFTLSKRFPDLDYFDADIPLALRYGVQHDVFPLAFCEMAFDENGRIHHITPLESRWQVEPTQPPLRILQLEPDSNPAHTEPSKLLVTDDKGQRKIPIRPLRLLLIQLQAILKRFDPDVILTRWGDTWLLPFLLAQREKTGLPNFTVNRDNTRDVLQRKENSYFTYGQVIYRGQQMHLFGRWHIDRQNAMMYGDYGLDGAFEQARVTGLPVQEIARKSPGSGITAMQMAMALQNKILIPWQKQQAESFKTARQLIRADRGGLVYQPLIGLHEDVAEIDFVSMYPSIMVQFNVSPETVGKGEQIVPELGIPIDQTKEGLVPCTLRPLLAKRIQIRQQLAQMSRRDCRYTTLKARSDALKWLLVVCFGYLGYKNARFGRIESHEAVTAYGREALLRAKEAAEDLGYTVLHMYVDGLWVQQTGHKRTTDFQPLLEEVTRRTQLPIAFEGIYKWVAFLPSRMDHRVSVANRYFGVFQDNVVKLRGIAARRCDTPPFITQTQLSLLQLLARMPTAQSFPAYLPTIINFLQQQMAHLKNGRIPLEHLLVTQTLSRTLAEYRTPSPAARATAQLEAMGKTRRPGQRIQFLYTRSPMGVHAWDLPQLPATKAIDVAIYSELLIRAITAVLQPFGVTEEDIVCWLKGWAWQRPLLMVNGE